MEKKHSLKKIKIYKKYMRMKDPMRISGNFSLVSELG